MKVQTTGTVESLRLLEVVLRNSGGVVIHNGEYGRDYMTRIDTQRKSFVRVWHLKVNGDFVKVRFWYENREGSMLKGLGNITASPRHFELLSEHNPSFKIALQKVVESVKVPTQEERNVTQVS